MILKVDFATLEMEDRANIRRREEERQKKEKFEAKKLKLLRNEIDGLEDILQFISSTILFEECRTNIFDLI